MFVEVCCVYMYSCKFYIDLMGFNKVHTSCYRFNVGSIVHSACFEDLSIHPARRVDYLHVALHK